MPDLAEVDSCNPTSRNTPQHPRDHETLGNAPLFGFLQKLCKRRHTEGPKLVIHESTVGQAEPLITGKCGGEAQTRGIGSVPIPEWQTDAERALQANVIPYAYAMPKTAR